MTKRLALVLAVSLLSLWKSCLAGPPPVGPSGGPQVVVEPISDNNSTQRACTLDELLPMPATKGRSKEWSFRNIVEDSYNCSCPAMKARYFCPTQESSAYPIWVPRPVASGSCTSATREELDVAPLPPNFKVLIYGNSHMRQVVEAMMCMYQGTLTSKRVSLGPLLVKTKVESDSQCRACFDRNQPVGMSSLHRMLLDNECIDDENDTFTCRCDDSKGEFFFENGATVHYTFLNRDPEKSLRREQREHGNDTLSSYDAVIMNSGNPPPDGVERSPGGRDRSAKRRGAICLAQYVPARDWG